MPYRYSIAAMLCVFLLASCTGGGGGTPVATGDQSSPSSTGGRIAFAPGNDGHYTIGRLPLLCRSDVRYMPLWRDNVRLGVGIDQGTENLGSLPVTGGRGATQVRHGRLHDGVGESTLRMFMADTSAGRTAHDDRRQPVTVSWDSSAGLQDQQNILRAMQMINTALPEEWKMTVAGRGQISIRFMGQTEYIQQYGDSWGISLYGSGDIVINRAYMNGGMRQAIFLLAHGMMHKMEFEHPPHHSNYDTIIESGRNAQGYGTIYDEEQGIPQPLSTLYPIDREALRNLYAASSFGPWRDTSLHLAGHRQHVAFGVALRNGYAEPWAYGLLPADDLAQNRRLSGSATWTGTLLGLPPQAAAVTGEATIGVSLGTLTGRADFTSLETWAANAAPGAAGTGTRWLDGDLGYTIRVQGNGFRETGGDAGRLSGIFVGNQHQGAAGTLERSDLTAAFGASR